MFEYNIVQERINNPYIGEYIAYGIKVSLKKENELTELSYTPDVFTSKELAENFVALCNKEQLDPVHLPQLIEDTLISATI